MRVWVVLLALVLSGCLAQPAPRETPPADVPYDPQRVTVDGVRLHNVSVAGAGGINLEALVYEPVGRLGASEHTSWPVVVFVHGWGGNKESYTAQASYPVATGITDPRDVDRLAMFAKAGFIAVAYDTRGFGASGGESTVAGELEMEDLDLVLDYIDSTYPHHGRVGILGGSYGGGHAMLAWSTKDRIATAASFYGWTDLASSLIPGGVPKLEWAQVLYAYGRGGTGRYDPMIDNWYQNIYTRAELDRITAEMQDRSAAWIGLNFTKPVYLCQGIQESLFPQIDQAWELAQGYVRATTYTGGHGSAPEACWQRALDWMQYFLGGYDTRVDAWPALETMDADGTGPYRYDAFPAVEPSLWRLRDGVLYEGPATNATFLIRQMLVSNPADTPSALQDQSGQASPFIPGPLQADPSAVAFVSAPFESEMLLVGRATLDLHVRSGTAPFQVAATLYRVSGDGAIQSLSHAAAAPLAETPENLRLNFTWTHARLLPGDQLQIKIAANDAGWWMPLLANYAVTFDGQSRAWLPLTAV